MFHFILIWLSRIILYRKSYIFLDWCIVNRLQVWCIVSAAIAGESEGIVQVRALKTFPVIEFCTDFFLFKLNFFLSILSQSFRIWLKFKQMMWLALEVFVCHLLFASVALVATLEIVVLALWAGPSTIRKWIFFIILLLGLITEILFERSTIRTIVLGLLIIHKYREVACWLIAIGLIHGSRA